MANRVVRWSRRVLLIAVLAGGVVPLTAATYHVRVDVRCLITLVKHCFDEFGISKATLECIKTGAAACQAPPTL
jgi:hypothetical protein